MSEWPYLTTEVMGCRQATAAYFLRGCPVVLEVGGGETPIAGAVPFDPRTDDPSVCVGGAYGLALLGLDLRGMTEEAWRRLEAVVRGARRVVVEFASDWHAGAEQAARIVTMGRAIVAQMTLDLSGNPMPTGGHPPRLQRRLIVLEPT